jgi:hypothetical protein
MTLEEQLAFVDAYCNNVAMVDRPDVADFVRRYNAGDDLQYCGDYTSIMDALCMWHDAIKWHTQQTKEALTLSLAELNRHARDTDSGELAVAAVEQALK